MSSRAVPAHPLGSRRRKVRTLLASSVLVVLAACSGTPTQDELVDALLRSGLTEVEATCAAAALYDNLGDDTIGAIAERGPSAVIDDVNDPDEPIDVARREIAACRTPDTTSPETTPPDTTAPDTTADATATTDAGAASSTTEP